MVCGDIPFDRDNAICKGDFTFETNLSTQCEELIRSCLAFNPEDRIQLFSIMNHPWMEMNLEKSRHICKEPECISETLKVDPIGEKYESCSNSQESYQTNPVSVPSNNLYRDYYGNSASSSFSSA